MYTAAALFSSMSTVLGSHRVVSGGDDKVAVKSVKETRGLSNSICTC